MTDFTDMNDCEFYKLGRNAMRIEMNVKAALKTIAAKGVVVPPDANSDGLANLIAKIPTSVEHAMWLPAARGGVKRLGGFCSQCATYSIDARSKYCPECGAKMDLR